MKTYKLKKRPGPIVQASIKQFPSKQWVIRINAGDGFLQKIADTKAACIKRGNEFFRDCGIKNSEIKWIREVAK